MADISRAELKYLIERQREELKALNEAGKLLGASAKPDELIARLSSYLRHAFPIALCAIWLLDQKKLHIKLFTPVPQIEVANAIRQLRAQAAGLLGRPVLEHESVPVMEEGGMKSFAQSTTTLRSHIDVPLTVKGQPIGLLGLFSGQPEAFTKEDHQAIGVIAEQLGAALHNALLMDELRRADELKSQMLSIVSHELSTPLTAMKEGVKLMLDQALGEITADQRDFLGTVMGNAERLERVIQKIKITTEIMTKQLKFTMESFDLRTLLSNVEKLYRPLALSGGVQLKLVEFPKPLFWTVDIPNTTMALSQLVENAIQAAPKQGFVSLKLSASSNEAEIQVQDTGGGIVKEALPTLFDRFQSVGDIHNRKMGGVGLGLFIAKSLIDGQGGSITVDSVVGEGTRMVVKLPKKASGP